MNVYDENKLPRFVIGDTSANDDLRVFVIHLHTPRFVMEMNEEESAVIHWIDPPAVDEKAVAKLMREAGEFYISEVERE